MMEMEKTKIKLEVGKSYQDRVGNIVRIVDTMNMRSYLSDDNYNYHEDGSFKYNKEKCDQDLIKEVDTMEKKTKIKLEVGKSYKDREGNIIRIISYKSTGERPYLGDDRCTYYEDGSFRPNKSKSGYDLTEEVDMMEKTKIKLEVGKSYKDKYGNIDHIADYVGGLKPLRGSSGLMYTEDGRFYIDKESAFDLIEEVTDITSTTTTTDPKGVHEVKYIATKNREVSKLEDSLREYICELVTIGKYQDAKELLNILI